MKKLLVLLLALSIFVTGLVSCNNTSSSTDDTTVPVTEDVTTTEEVTTEPPKPVSKVSPATIVKNLDPNVKSFAPTDGCREAVLSGFSKDTVIKAFKDEDFKELDYATYVEGTKFETVVLTRTYNTVTLYCNESKNEVRVIWESDAKLNCLKTTDQTGQGSLLIAQVGVERSTEKDNPLNGMGYVIKLSNGNAIIIDGGFNTDICAKNIYNTLEKLEIAKSKNKYVIEAWIITHGHGDHAGAFAKFSTTYSTSATVKNIILSYPPESLVTDGGKSFSKGNFSNASMIIPHAGINYYFGNATISMLYTPELVYSTTSKIAYFNNSSLVFKISVGDSSVMFLGDAGELPATELVSIYPSSVLKSNIFQMTHHGLYTIENSGHTWDNVKKLYDSIDADYAFLPMHEYLEDNSRNGRHTVLITWAAVDHQIAYIMNVSDNHGLDSISQSYYTEFTNSVKNGTATKSTLYGYDGINKVVNKNGLVTYLGGNETDPMVTVFELNGKTVTLKENKELHEWLGK